MPRLARVLLLVVDMMAKTRVLVVLTALFTATSGCMVGNSGRGFVYALDTGLIIGGGVAVSKAQSSDCGGDREPYDPTGPIVAGACATGKAGLLVLGVGLVAVGVLGLAVTGAYDSDVQDAVSNAGTRAAQAALEEVDCEPHVDAYREARFAHRRAEVLRDMPSECRVRARATVRNEFRSRR